MSALTRLGLLNPPEQADQTEDLASDYVLVMDGLSPSLIPVHKLMMLIKKRVPVIECSNFLERYGVVHDEDVDMECSVCLNCVERSHEIRELCNCYHVFHRECLDRWVDEGQVTCPLCRTMMFPAQTQKIIQPCRSMDVIGYIKQYIVYRLHVQPIYKWGMVIYLFGYQKYGTGASGLTNLIFSTFFFFWDQLIFRTLIQYHLCEKIRCTQFLSLSFSYSIGFPLSLVHFYLD